MKGRAMALDLFSLEGRVALITGGEFSVMIAMSPSRVSVVTALISVMAQVSLWLAGRSFNWAGGSEIQTLVTGHAGPLQVKCARGLRRS